MVCVDARATREPATHTARLSVNHTIVFGGNFDPPHLGHLRVIRALLDRLGPDTVLVVPAGHSPLKTASGRSRDDRRAFTRALVAAAGDDRVEPCWLEFDRSGPSYTVDTLSDLREAYPARRWSLAIGTDQVEQFGRWKDGEQILRMADLIHVVRPGWDSEAIAVPGSGTLHVDGPALSSTLVRERLSRGLDVSHLVPATVLAVITERGLYRTPSVAGP